MNDVYVLNDPTEGFVVARNDGAGGAADYMNFLVTDTYYYNVDGKEVAFKASEKDSCNLTYSSLNQIVLVGKVRKPLTELMLKLTAQL